MDENKIPIAKFEDDLPVEEAATQDEVSTADGPVERLEEGAAPKEEAPPAESAPVVPKQVSPVGLDAESQMRRMSRRSFLWAIVAGTGTFAGFKVLNTRRLDDSIPWPLRQVLNVNGEIAQDLFSTARLAPTFPAARATEPRANGDVGLGDDFDPKAWKMTVSGLASGNDLELTLDKIKALPKIEMTTELKCIEGWSVIVTWAGARFVDFMKKYPPATVSGDDPDVQKKPTDLVPYVSLTTPDGAYFVGLDMESALHPQTLLCYEMNGKPLSLDHGAPLRLVTPVKYGIKHLKRIGNIEFTAQRPEDYWAQQGYDWYAGH